MRQYKKVTHVIFDLDGTLIESESVLCLIMNTIGWKYGKKYTKEIKEKVLGTPEHDTAAIAVREMGLPITPEEFLKIYTPMCRAQLQNPSLMPGAKELIEHLRNHKIPLAIATSSTQEAVEDKRQHHQEFFNNFHHIVCGCTDKEVKNGKPAPDIFLLAAARFPDKPDPSECLVMEDAPNGIRAACAAGMQSIMIPNPDAPEEQSKDATLVLKSLKDFKPELFGLPALN